MSDSVDTIIAAERALPAGMIRASEYAAAALELKVHDRMCSIMEENRAAVRDLQQFLAKLGKPATEAAVYKHLKLDMLLPANRDYLSRLRTLSLVLPGPDIVIEYEGEEMRPMFALGEN